MNINNFKNLHLIFNEVKYNYFKTSAVIVLLGTINILMDVLGLATLVPIIDLVLNSTEAKDKYLIYLNFFKPNIENTEELILIFIAIILLLNLIKFIVTIINSYYSNFVLKDIKHLISKKILNVVAGAMPFTIVPMALAKLQTGPITKRGAKQLAVWILVQIPM